MYSLTQTAGFRREVKKLSLDLMASLQGATRLLEENPFHTQLQIKKLVGQKNCFRIRVGRYRLVYKIEGKNIKLLHFVPRDQAYSKRYFYLLLF